MPARLLGEREAGYQRVHVSHLPLLRVAAGLRGSVRLPIRPAMAPGVIALAPLAAWDAPRRRLLGVAERFLSRNVRFTIDLSGNPDAIQGNVRFIVDGAGSGL